MDRALEFVGNHPFLFGILAVLAVLFFAIENKRSGKKISPNTLGMMVNSQNAQLIDIRAKKKFVTGYIQGSRNIPFTELKARIEEIHGRTSRRSRSNDWQRKCLSFRRRYWRLARRWHATRWAKRC